MIQKEVNKYFDDLFNLFTDNDLLGKPKRSYNMDENGIQVNNKTRTSTDNA